MVPNDVAAPSAASSGVVSGYTPETPSSAPINYYRATTAPIFDSRMTRPYPPTNRVGLVDPHDRPYLEYGQKGTDEARKQNK